ncbi:MAG: universal stress protein [Pseudaminobacter sp.]
MPFKTMLGIIGADHSDADAKSAIKLCRDAGAHLSVLVLGVAAPPPAGEYAAVVSDAWLQERQEAERKLEERVKQLTALLARDGLSADVTGEYVEQAWIDMAVGRHARYADLTIVGPELARTAALKSSVLNGVLFEAERPVLIAPEGVEVSLSPATILVAWNSGLEASRAVRESIELLAGAEAVHVAMVDPEVEENGPEPGADIAAYLARHGAKVTVDRVPGLGRSTTDVLMRHAADISADLVVMGAYGHSRLRQRIFGGVTRSVIEDTPMPVLMAR